MNHLHTTIRLRITAAAIIIAAALLFSGCGEKEEAAPAGAPYPASLSSDSTPSEVAAVLIDALDAEDTATLVGLVAVKAETKAMDDIYKQYGRKSNIDHKKAAGLAVAGWNLSYSFYEPGATVVESEEINGDLATVRALGRNATTGEDRLLDISLAREDNLWKVKAGLKTPDH